eukprot:4767320-Amphidinium_carterae.1
MCPARGNGKTSSATRQINHERMALRLSVSRRNKDRANLNHTPKGSQVEKVTTRLESLHTELSSMYSPNNTY